MENIITNTETSISAKQYLLNTIIPEQTSWYKPVSHKKLIDITLEALDRNNFITGKELYSYSAEGNKANGKYHLNYGTDDDMGLMVAWQNSYDKSLSLKFAVGAHVFICENGMVKGDIGTFKSKHIGEIQTVTPKLLAEYIQNASQTFNKMVIEKERMKEIEVTKRTSAELLGRLYLEEQFINSTQLNIIKGQLNKPSFDYGYENSLWELYNHITYSLKHASPMNWMTQQINNHKFITEEFSIAETI